MASKTLRDWIRPFRGRPEHRRTAELPEAQIKLAYLTKNELFHGMPIEDLHQIESNLAMVTCEKGRIFYMPGETPETLYILKAGRVQLYYLSPEGKKLVLDILEPGTVFGEMSLIGQGLQNTFAEALEPCVLCVMSRHEVVSLLTAYPETALHLLKIVAERLRHAEKRLSEFSFMDVSKRLAALLLRLYERGGNPITGYSHQDLADLVGSYRETVTLTLNQFKQQGLIGIERKALTVLDPQGLAALAGEVSPNSIR